MVTYSVVCYRKHLDAKIPGDEGDLFVDMADASFEIVENPYDHNPSFLRFLSLFPIALGHCLC